MNRSHNLNGLTQPNVMPSVATLYRNGGLVSEIAYDPQQPFVLNLLLPFLQQLAEQPRWQLWLAPQYKLSRSWLTNVGLPENKIMQMTKLNYEQTIITMEKALSSGNFSSVLAWLPEVDDAVRDRSQKAAEQGNSYGFIMISKITNYSH